MSIVFNYFDKNNPATANYLSGLSLNTDITINDFNNYKKYTIALLVSYPTELEELSKIKNINPSIKIGVIDPRSKELISKYLDLIDFFIVDSSEMRDFWLDYGKPIHTYYEFPLVNSSPKSHVKKDKIIIGYHGNKVHLTSMYPNLTHALEYLGKKYEIQLLAIYNKEVLGDWSIGRPKNIEIEDIQWSEAVYDEELSRADIGIVPSLVPVKKNSKKKSIISKFYLANEDDYLIRFKMLTNPGRMIVFASLGIPVVAELCPSNIEFIKHGDNGFICYSEGAWINALEQLIVSHHLRDSISKKMYKQFESTFLYEVQNRKLNQFLSDITEDKVFYKGIVKEPILEKLKFNYAHFFNLIERIKTKI